MVVWPDRVTCHQCGKGLLFGPFLEDPMRFHPAEYLTDELTERGHKDPAKGLVELLGCTTEEAAMLLDGSQTVTVEWAIRIGSAFGTSSELWMHLQDAYERGR